MSTYPLPGTVVIAQPTCCVHATVRGLSKRNLAYFSLFQEVRLAAAADDDIGRARPFGHTTDDLRLAYVHGDHWHGRIELVIGEEVEVDVRFLEEDDRVIPLGGEFTVRARLGEGHPAGLVSWENHGDHLDIEGLAAGETRIVLQLWHDDHAEWETAALRVVVSEP